MVALLLLTISSWIGAVGILSYVLALMYNSRVKKLGRPERYTLFERILFAGFSSFEEPQARVSNNPRHSSFSTVGGVNEGITLDSNSLDETEQQQEEEGKSNLGHQVRQELATFASNTRQRFLQNAGRARESAIQMKDRVLKRLAKSKEKNPEESGASTLTSPSEVQEEKAESRWEDLKY